MENADPQQPAGSKRPQGAADAAADGSRAEIARPSAGADNARARGGELRHDPSDARTAVDFVGDSRAPKRVRLYEPEAHIYAAGAPRSAALGDSDRERGSGALPGMTSFVEVGTDHALPVRAPAILSASTAALLHEAAQPPFSFNFVTPGQQRAPVHSLYAQNQRAALSSVSISSLVGNHDEAMATAALTASRPSPYNSGTVVGAPGNSSDAVLHSRRDSLALPGVSSAREGGGTQNSYNFGLGMPPGGIGSYRMHAGNYLNPEPMYPMSQHVLHKVRSADALSRGHAAASREDLLVDPYQQLMELRAENARLRVELQEAHMLKNALIQQSQYMMSNYIPQAVSTLAPQYQPQQQQQQPTGNVAYGAPVNPSAGNLQAVQLHPPDANSLAPSRPAGHAAATDPSESHTHSRFSRVKDHNGKFVEGQTRYWSPMEHDRFLEALELYGSRDARAIAGHVRTRSIVQVRSHMQKYFLRLQRESDKTQSENEAQNHYPDAPAGGSSDAGGAGGLPQSRSASGSQSRPHTPAGRAPYDPATPAAARDTSRNISESASGVHLSPTKRA
ncbi:Myb-like protein I [Porphyridium purpureum]|uniref:Myb-like protein I n=1 Tax=Porphyridium purpureum TaxID=35688 RepID=A0A5J4YJB4_PORPP|nr:Myb-like protein I [Porphyridium purpureum]|eukprot:POR1707..scf251_18